MNAYNHHVTTHSAQMQHTSHLCHTQNSCRTHVAHIYQRNIENIPQVHDTPQALTHNACNTQKACYTPTLHTPIQNHTLQTYTIHTHFIDLISSTVTHKTPHIIYTYISPTRNINVIDKHIEAHGPYPTETHMHDRHNTPTSWMTHSPPLDLTNTSHIPLTHTTCISHAHMARHTHKAYRLALHQY